MQQEDASAKKLQHNKLLRLPTMKMSENILKGLNMVRASEAFEL